MSERPPVTSLSLLGGALLGVLLSWLVIALSALATLESSGAGVVMVIAFVGPPLLCLALLMSPRTRYAGTGVVIGLAVGTITGSGVCATLAGLGGG